MTEAQWTAEEQAAVDVLKAMPRVKEVEVIDSPTSPTGYQARARFLDNSLATASGDTKLDALKICVQSVKMHLSSRFGVDVEQ